MKENTPMTVDSEFPRDFQECIRFHGHLCPGLALGYVAARAGARALGVTAAEDEEVVAVVENDSCAVDAIQVILGCTFGKGNLVFRDWGKQVFTFLNRKDGRAVRVAFRGPMPGHDQRRALKEKIDAGHATDAEQAMFAKLRQDVVMTLLTADPEEFFEVREVTAEMPPQAAVVATRPCEICGEATMTTRLLERDGRAICRGCAEGVE
jgi:formylmethanofuran dehydrogenase subunit E